MFVELRYEENGIEDTGSNLVLSAFASYAIGLAIILLGALLIIALAYSDKAAPSVATLALENLSSSGVENPVTAVLLNFRSYDTLLELAVLLIVAVAMLPVPNQMYKAANKPWLSIDNSISTSPALFSLLGWLVPLSILIGGYLLWTGAYLPGGAFQAGAVIAGAGVSLSLAGCYYFNWRGLNTRVAISIGLLVFIFAAQLSAFVTGTTLAYPQNYAGISILFIEVAATASIAVTLLLLFNQLQSINNNFSKGKIK